MMSTSRAFKFPSNNSAYAQFNMSSAQSDQVSLLLILGYRCVPGPFTVSWRWTYVCDRYFGYTSDFDCKTSTK